MAQTRGDLAETIAREAQPLAGEPGDYDQLLELIGDAQLVLLGEASHGTHEFYSERARITRRLIEEKGFNAVAVEADWPDAYHVNRWVGPLAPARRQIESADPLAEFKRFPRWMWRNADVLGFVRWLRAHNATAQVRAGFYGLDLYSLRSSIEAVLTYLDQVDPQAAMRARYRYGCFEDFGEDPQSYGYAASFGLEGSCEAQVVQQLLELQRQASRLLQPDGRAAIDELFYAEQNARLVKTADAYYRTMIRGQVESWNLRDRHMAETLEALRRHLALHAGQARVAVWAHNSHLGDARATEMAERGELNLGQLVRERHGAAAVLIGFSTYSGTVTAASDWGSPAQRKRVRPALPGSYEALFHSAGRSDFVLPLREHTGAVEGLLEPRLERAIGVIYRPETERLSHYFHARLPDQFDAIVHLDQTQAVEPLERAAEWERGEVPETYPFGV